MSSNWTINRLGDDACDESVGFLLSQQAVNQPVCDGGFGLVLGEIRIEAERQRTDLTGHERPFAEAMHCRAECGQWGNAASVQWDLYDLHMAPLQPRMSERSRPSIVTIRLR